MNFSIFLLFLILSSSQVFSQRRFVGGNVAAKNQFPYYVFIENQKDENFVGICGGSVISENWVLTAGHCLINYQKVRVYENRLFLNDDSDSIKHEVKNENVFVHEEYEGSSTTAIRNDIALIYIEDGLNESNAVKLVSRFDEDLVGIQGIIAGHGNIYDNISGNALLFGTLPIIEQEKCLKVYQNDFNTDQFICVGATTFSSVCRGDSGGGLVVTLNQEQKIAGLVSFGAKSCVDGSPNAFTKVSNYLDWIHAKTGIDIE